MLLPEVVPCDRPLRGMSWFAAESEPATDCDATELAVPGDACAPWPAGNVPLPPEIPAEVSGCLPGVVTTEP